MKKILLFFAIFSVFVICGCTTTTSILSSPTPETMTYEVTNKCPTGSPAFHVRLTPTSKSSSQVYQFDVAPGETSGKVTIPKINYMQMAWTDDGHIMSKPVEMDPKPDEKSGSFQIPDCPPPQLLITPESPTYYFANNCSDPASSTWHWKFENLSNGHTLEVIVPVGKSQSGNVPVGVYLVGNWDDAGVLSYNPVMTYIGGLRLQFNVNRCPNEAPLRDAPIP